MRALSLVPYFADEEGKVSPCAHTLTHTYTHTHILTIGAAVWNQPGFIFSYCSLFFNVSYKVTFFLSLGHVVLQPVFTSNSEMFKGQPVGLGWPVGRRQRYTRDEGLFLPLQGPNAQLQPWQTAPS
jgi:hypothetical protein